MNCNKCGSKTETKALFTSTYEHCPVCDGGAPAPVFIHDEIAKQAKQLDEAYRKHQHGTSHGPASPNTQQVPIGTYLAPLGKIPATEKGITSMLEYLPGFETGSVVLTPGEVEIYVRFNKSQVYSRAAIKWYLYDIIWGKGLYLNLKITNS